MRPTLLLFLLLLGCHAEDNLKDVTLCDQECYPADNFSQARTGSCRPGRWACDADAKNPICTGYHPPQAETCNGLDDDCDGVADNGLQNCCAIGTPEVCDGLDNDCDGKIDEPEDFDIEFCYEGLGRSAAYAPCRPGVRRCIGGHWSCDGQVVPVAEVCNGIDDDCDGDVDDGLTTHDFVDIVFVIDNSGSMTNHINTVKRAVMNFSGRYYGVPEIQWAYVAAPGYSTIYGSKPLLVQNLGGVDPFSAAIMSETGIGGSSDEPTLDALYEICDVKNPMRLGWKQGSRRIIILVTDEAPQSYGDPIVTYQQVAAQCRTAGIPVYAFLNYYVDPGWVQIVADTGGIYFDIQSVTADRDMEATIATVTCR